jgi:hypothetical protein
MSPVAKFHTNMLAALPFALQDEFVRIEDAVFVLVVFGEVGGRGLPVKLGGDEQTKRDGEKANVEDRPWAFGGHGFWGRGK